MEETRLSLIERVADLANQESWADFKSIYEPVLFGYVGRLNVRSGYGLSQADMDDIVQTIFATLVHKMPTFEFDRTRGRFRTWLWTITHNAIMDWLRVRRRIQKTEDVYKDTKKPPEQDFDEDADRDHEQEVMKRALAKVQAGSNEKTWTCFELHLLQGKSGAEVGAVVDLPANSVYVNASRILEKVKKEVALLGEGFTND